MSKILQNIVSNPWMVMKTNKYYSQYRYPKNLYIRMGDSLYRENRAYHVSRFDGLQYDRETETCKYDKRLWYPV